MNYRTAKINLIKQGNLEQIRGIVNLSSQLADKEIGERIKKSVKSSLSKYNVPINIRIEYVNTLSIGGEVNLFGIFSNRGKMNFDNPVIIGSSSLLERGKKSEIIGKEVADKFVKEISSEAAVDSHLADQLIQFMGLLPESEIFTSKVTNHSLTNFYVVEKFLPVGFKVNKNNIKVLEK